jgi:hypothetical protein
MWDGSPATFAVPWAALPWLVGFAVVVALIASIVPARSASLANPLTALRDARAEVSPAGDRGVAALVLAITGVVITVAGLVVFALPTQDGPAWFALLGAVLGPILVIVAFLLGSRQVLRGTAAVLGRLDTAARIAGRDAAASPRRVAPAMAVIAASAFVATAVGTLAATLVGSFSDSYLWTAAPNSVVVTIDIPSPEAEAAARDLVASTGPDRIVTVSTPAISQLGAEAEPDFPTYRLAVNSGDCETCFAPYAELTIVAADDLDAVLDTDIPESVRDVLRDGGVVIPTWPGQETGVTQAQIQESTLGRDLEAGDGMPDPVRTTEVPAVEIPVHSAATTIITPETAAAAGIPLQPQAVIGTRSAPLSSAEIDALQARNDAGGALGVFVETGPAETPATAAPVIFVPAMILALAASLIALGLSRYERRRDEATLAALGAPRRLLRRIGAWEALIVTGTGALVGTLAGSALVIGFAGLAGPADPLSMAWPWWWIGAFALVLPAVMTLVGWLVPPRRSDLTRRTAIA